VVGIRVGAISGNMKVSFQAARCPAICCCR